MARVIATGRGFASGRTLAVGRSVAANRSLAVTTIPLPPVLTNAAAGDAEVALYWNFSVGADSYSVYRALVSGGPYTLVVGSLANPYFLDADLENGVAVFYVARAVNSAGESANSNELSATPESLAASSALVSGAGSVHVNALYTPRGTLNGRTYFNPELEPDDTEISAILWNGSQWLITQSDASVAYSGDGDVARPWDVIEWSGVDGIEPVPTVTEA